MPYTPTHVVPAGGLPAWGAPDGSQQPVATLEGGLDVALVEQRGQWARVACSNGWEGWVDSDRLTPHAVAGAVEPAIPEPPIASPIIPEPPAVRDDTQLGPEVAREGSITEIMPVPEADPGHAPLVVPDGGIPTWVAPDPSQPPAATVAGGTEVRVVEERGQWARIEAANGWTGWVDSSRLQASGTAATDTPASDTAASDTAAPVTEFAAPPEGIQAWPEPDPSQPPVATLHGGTELHLLDQRGQWAQVEAAGGWTVWVDATLLVPRG